MTFQWPGMLWLLALIPVLVAAYLLAGRRRARIVRRHAAFADVKDAQGRGPGFRRHAPPLLFVLGVTVGILALSRPSLTITLPANRGTVILSIDVSGSMRARDIVPNRMEAVKDAARSFVNGEPRGVRIGIVAFSGSAFLVQPPTTDKSQVLEGIDRLRPQMFTAIGSGLIAALDALFPNLAENETGSADAPLVSTPDQETPAVAPGSDKSAAIVLLSDGQSNQGPDPLDAAEQAANLGVRVFTVGVGTKGGAMVGFEGFSFHAILDETTLRKIALITGGSYFKASSAGELRSIYTSLGSRLELEKSHTEITALLAAVAFALLLVMALLSLAWFNRVL